MKRMTAAWTRAGRASRGENMPWAMCLAADCAYRGAPDGLAVGDHGVPGVGWIHIRLAMVG